MAHTDRAGRFPRARRDSEQKVVAARAKLGRTENLDLDAVALGDSRCFLRQDLRSQLIRRGVLPLACVVGRLSGFLCGDDLVFAALAKTGEDQIVDLATFGLRAGLAGPALEGAHDAAFDHRLQAVDRDWIGAYQRQALVAVCACCTDQLMVRRAHPLAVEIVCRPNAVEDHAPGCDASMCGYWHDFVDPALELGIG